MRRDHKPRGPRIKVVIRARMRGGGPQIDVCIRDISTCGMLVQAAKPPPTGTYVEIVGDDVSITGQVRWSTDRRFGIATRERINLAALIGDSTAPSLSAAVLSAGGGSANLYRGSKAGFLARLERSRNLGSGLQFAFIAACAGGMAVFIFKLVHEILSGPMRGLVTHL